MKRVLVTGATGFIGRHALGALAQRGYEVHGVSLEDFSSKNSSSRDSSLKSSDVIWHRADLLNPEQTSKLLGEIRPSHLLHFAWYVEHGKYLTAPENRSWLEASLFLAEKFAAFGGKRFVGAGTCLEYDWSQGLCSEKSTPIKPQGLYGEAKNSLHEGLKKLKNLESYAWGRLFFLYGPGEPPTRLIPVVINALKQDKPLPPIYFKRIRDFMHVQDVADAFAALLDSPVTGPVNIASGEAHPLKEIASQIAIILHKPQPHLTEPPQKDKEPEILQADINRLTTEVHWQPQYTLTQGLTKYLDA